LRQRGQLYAIILYLLAILGTTSSKSFAQLQPAFIQKTKADGLQSNTIYSLKVAKNGVLYIGHGKGLSSYDGHVFTNYPNAKYPFTELTNVMQCANGEIYCEAFNNVIYRLDKDSLRYVYFAFNTGGFRASFCYGNTIVTQANDSLIFYNADKNTLSKVSEKYLPTGIDASEAIAIFSLSTAASHEVIALDKNLKAFRCATKLLGNIHNNGIQSYIVSDRSPCRLYHFQGDNQIMIPLDNTSMQVNYVVDDSDKKYLCTTKGLLSYADNGNKAPIQILPQYNISSVVRTLDNCLALGSIDKGLLLIPNNEVKTLPYFGDKLFAMCSIKDDLLVTNSIGEVIHYNPLSHKAGIKAILNNFVPKFVLHHESSGTTIVSNKLTRFKKGTKTTSEACIIKDYCYAEDGLLLATHVGIFAYAVKPNSWLLKYASADQFLTPGLVKLQFADGFTASIKYDSTHNKIYFNNYNGIFEFTPGTIEPKQLPEPMCVLTDMAVYNGQLYLSSKNKGLQVFDGRGYERAYEKSLPSGIFYRLYTHKDELWILAEDAIYCCSAAVVKTYNVHGGVPYDNAVGLVISDNTVYVNDGSHVFQFAKDIATKNEENSVLRIKDVYSVSRKNKIAFGDKLDTKDNTIKITLELLNYVSGKVCHIAYRINDGPVVDLDATDRSLLLSNLTPDDYSIEFYNVSNNVTAPMPSARFTFSINEPFYKKWWFTLLMVAATAWLVYFSSKQILRRWKREALGKETKMLLEKELDKSILSGIKAQMNPHFIFNALNTIQSYIYSNDKHNASMYISKFSSLTRNILSMSTKEAVPLQEELESLNLYLELEKMRFEDSFEYTFEVDEALNRESTTLPSMLIQPYVENALKHGLLHKKTNRQLCIAFKKKDDMLEVTIEDNGIGRKRSAELAAIKNRMHQSFAMEANKKRIEILSAQNGKISLEVIDKHSPLGEATGTIVKIVVGQVNT
jgi:hypothetical protein